MNAGELENQKIQSENSSVSLGDLEKIRTRLGLSRRQLCKILKVDPSAWTRWMKSPNGAPAHVYQSLNWYLQLVEQNPEMHAPQHLEQKLENSTRESDFQIQALKREIQALKSTDSSKQEVFEVLSTRIQESFENILLRFRDQMQPQKTLELETLKYENRKLQDRINDLQHNMEKIFKKLETKLAAKAKPKPKPQSKKKLTPKKKKPAFQKKRFPKKIPKKKRPAKKKLKGRSSRRG